MCHVRGTFYLLLITQIAILHIVIWKRTNMKKIFKYLGIIFGVVLFDQIVKWWVLNTFMHIAGNSIYINAPFIGNKWDIIAHPMMPHIDASHHITDFFNIVFTWNPGTSFSLFQRLGENTPFIIIVVTAFVIGFIFYYLFCRAQSYERLPLAFIIGGALGNLIDRVRYGAVIDFLDFHIGGVHWPAFNVADMFICVGVGLYILNWFLARRRCMRANKQ